MNNVEICIFLCTNNLFYVKIGYLKRKKGTLMAKKRFGDRKDGRRLRTIDPMSVVSPYIMGTRSGCQNQLTDSFDTEECEKYLTDKKKDGVKGLSLMHIIIAAYLRTVSQYPAINRYIAGQRIYSRDKVIISLVIKRELKLESPDTVIKVEFSPRDTIMDVYEKFNKAIDEYRSDPGSSFDNLAKVLNFFPGLVLKFAIGTLRFMDYFCWLSYSLQKLSPFHASLFITSMGSLGIPAVCHHLYVGNSRFVKEHCRSLAVGAGGSSEEDSRGLVFNGRLTYARGLVNYDVCRAVNGRFACELVLRVNLSLLVFLSLTVVPVLNGAVVAGDTAVNLGLFTAFGANKLLACDISVVLTYRVGRRD